MADVTDPTVPPTDQLRTRTETLETRTETLRPWRVTSGSNVIHLIFADAPDEEHQISRSSLDRRYADFDRNDVILTKI